MVLSWHVLTAWKLRRTKDSEKMLWVLLRGGWIAQKTSRVGAVKLEMRSFSFSISIMVHTIAIFLYVVHLPALVLLI